MKKRIYAAIAVILAFGLLGLNNPPYDVPVVDQASAAEVIEYGPDVMIVYSSRRSKEEREAGLVFRRGDLIVKKP